MQAAQASAPPRTLAGLEDLLSRTAVLAREAPQSQAARDVTLAEIAGGHAAQLEFMEQADLQEANGVFVHPNVIALCSRRAAKTTGICGLLATEAMRRHGFQIYFGATIKAVKIPIWETIWKPLCAKHRYPVSHNDGTMTTTFATGAIVQFTGSDDAAHVETYRGGKWRRAVCDEAQNRPISVIKLLVEDILPPGLSDTGGQLIMAGTIPEVPAGKFYDTWVRGDGWLKRNWSRWDNPHMGDQAYQQERLDAFLKASNRTTADPLVRRDWFGELVFDSSATAYSYERRRNGYTPEEPDWLAPALASLSSDPLLPHLHRTKQPNDGTCRHGVMAAEPMDGVVLFSCAVDPGAARDRFSVSVMGWGFDTDVVQHVFEFSSARKANLKWSQIAPLLRLIQEHYAPSWWFYDAGGSKVVMDGFVADSGVPALQPAVKTGLRGQVERVANLQLTGRWKVMEGSAAEEDYQKAMWDADARARMQWAWASSWHPDPAESCRYCVAPYFDGYEAPEPEKTQEVIDREKHELAQRRHAATRSANILDEDMDAAVFGDEDDAFKWD